MECASHKPCKIRGWCISKSAFGIKENLMQPYPENHLTKKERIFNYRLSTARKLVESAFGLFMKKWSIFHR
ncbi:hypothetical protein PR048_023361 [Dryococelus australis]|uniref:DDE Tnp4 domain-containing protein n=1 Tax=Dryococelus australis TaxID=614101 RepID=A0ABQ9GTY9_9NEOP|nr:hypothetical protein PR048_023361 [Dryococelus australis]